MLKTIIIEDELYVRKGLRLMLNTFENNISILAECETVENAVREAKKHKPNLVLLDVELKDGSGFDFIEQTSSLSYKIIFITAYEKYAFKAIKNNPVDYLLKPIDKVELQKVILKIEKDLLHKCLKDKIIISLQNSYQIIEYKNLLYCKSDKGYTTFYLKGGKEIVSSKPIKEFEVTLPSSIFFRVHQSYILNIKLLDRYDKSGYAILETGDKIPISQSKKEDFISTLLSMY